MIVAITPVLSLPMTVIVANFFMLDRLFRLSENGMAARTEAVAGPAALLTIAYIIFAQPMVLSGEMFGKPPGMDFHLGKARSDVRRFLLVHAARKEYQ